MSIKTTCIGAYPKPSYIAIGNFAETREQTAGDTRSFTYTQDDADQVSEELPEAIEEAKGIFQMIG